MNALVPRLLKVSALFLCLVIYFFNAYFNLYIFFMTDSTHANHIQGKRAGEGY